MKPTNGRSSTRLLEPGDTDARFRSIHPTARISQHAVIGAPGEWRDQITRYPVFIAEDVMVREGARIHGGIERSTLVGARTWIMSGAYVAHDVHIGEDCDVAPNATIGGLVTIGDRVKIGLGAVINPGVTIGDGARIGSGTVVIRDVPPGETWVGVPARRIR